MGYTCPAASHYDRNVTGVSYLDDLFERQRARTLGAWSEVVYGGGVRAYRLVKLVGGGAFVIPYLDQTPARNRHAAVILHAELPLDDYLVGHSGGVGDALYLLVVVSGYAGCGRRRRGRLSSPT